MHVTVETLAIKISSRVLCSAIDQGDRSMTIDCLLSGDLSRDLNCLHRRTMSANLEIFSKKRLKSALLNKLLCKEKLFKYIFYMFKNNYLNRCCFNTLLLKIVFPIKILLKNCTNWNKNYIQTIKFNLILLCHALISKNCYS